MLRAALRRFTIVLAFGAGAALLLGLAVAGLSKDGLLRSLAIGFYVFGVILFFFAFILGTRPPVRGKGDGGFIGFGRWLGSGVRWPTRQEHVDAPNTPALIATLGLCLVLIGVAIDPRT